MNRTDKAIKSLLADGKSVRKFADNLDTLFPQTFELDNYDRCMLYGEEALYCRLTFQITSINNSSTLQLLKKLNSDSNKYKRDLLRHGVCVPETCNTRSKLSESTEIIQTLEECYNRKYQYLGVEGKVINTYCETLVSPYPVDVYDILFGIAITLYVAFVAYASVRGETEGGRILRAFSVQKNWNRLTTVNFQKPELNALRCFQGLRFYGIIFVITFHTIISRYTFPLSNSHIVYSGRSDIAACFIQTFFLMSAWLLTYNFLFRMEGRETVGVTDLIFIFIQRYIRLTPLLAVVIGLHGTWLVHFSRGPMWDQMIGNDYRMCRKSWWTTLLYVNNVIDRNRKCVVVSWYTSVDTQLFLLGLFILRIVWRYKSAVYIMLGSILFVHVSTLFTVMYKNDWDGRMITIPEDLYNLTFITREWWHTLRGSFYSNFPGMVAGIFYGYIFYTRRGKTIFKTKVQILCAWIFSLGFILSIFYIPFILSHFPNNKMLFILYGSFNRTIFAAGCGMALLGMTDGKGSIFKRILEWKPTYVLGRVTYGVFLIHLTIIHLNLASKRSPLYIGGIGIYVEVFGYIIISFIGSLILTLLFEMPVSELQKTFIANFMYRTHRKCNE